MRAALAGATATLGAAGVPSARLEARLLLAHVLGIDAADLIARPARRLDDVEAAAFADLVARRARREPIAHILGAREFWSLPFAVTKDTLIPRPDSETLVEEALARVRDRAAPLAVLDLGTGSGCLLLALLKELPRAWGVGVDIGRAALDVARLNAARLGLEDRVAWVQADWAAALRGPFDLIVVNPPYVPTGEIATLAPEVEGYEPRCALAGGVDGLDAYRVLGEQLASVLSLGGAACVEIGKDQSPAVRALLAAAGLRVLGVRRDLGGIERCVALARAS